jgi:hypothetical protein
VKAFGFEKLGWVFAIDAVHVLALLGKDAPCTRPIERYGAQPILGGLLHHRYARI